MKEIAKWLRLAFLMLIPPVGVIAVNLIGDTANLFHSSVNKDIAGTDSFYNLGESTLQTCTRIMKTMQAGYMT